MMGSQSLIRLNHHLSKISVSIELWVCRSDPPDPYIHINDNTNTNSYFICSR